MSIWRKSRSMTMMPDPGKDNKAFEESNATSPVDTTRIVSIVFDDNRQNVDHSKSHRTPQSMELVKYVSPLYAIVVVIIGFLFPLTEALKEQWLQTEYYATFVTYLLSLSIIFLIYFIVYLTYQSRFTSHKQSTKASSSSTDRDSDIDNDKDRHIDRPESGGGDNEEISKSLSCPNPVYGRKIKQVTIGTGGGGGSGGGGSGGGGSGGNAGRVAAKVKISKSNSNSYNGILTPERDYADYRTEIPYPSKFIPNGRSPTGHNSFINHANSCLELTNGDVRRSRSLNQNSKTLMASMVNVNVEDDSSDIEEAWVDLSKIGNIFSHEGSSLYLRFATLLFGLCNVIYVGLEIQNTMVPKEDCNNVVKFGWIFVIRLVFLILQTYFLFKYPMVEIDKNESLARFGLVHIMATNVCLWLKTLVLEIMNEFQHQEDSQYQDTNKTEGPLDCDYFSGVLSTLSPYLFPFVLEYSLIAMGTLATTYSSIVEISESDSIGRGIEHLFKIQVPECPEGNHDNTGHDDKKDAILRKSHLGLFLGILLLSGAVITIIMFYAADTDVVTIDLLYISTDLVVHTLLLIVTVAGLVQTNRLSYIAKPIMVDDVLLILAMTGSFIYELSLIMSASTFIDGNPSGKEETVEIIQVCASLVSLIQTLLQVVLIGSGFRRYPSKRKHLEQMPGRGSVTFLIVGNVVVWICRTMQAKAVSAKQEVDYYGDIVWLLLINIDLPLLLFFRFHSSICLADIWHNAYYPVDAKLQKKKVRAREKQSGMLSTVSAALVRVPSCDLLPNLLIRSLSRSSSVANLESLASEPESSASSVRHFRSRSNSHVPKMIEGIDIVSEDGVIYREEERVDETCVSSM